MKEAIAKAGALIEAMEYIRQFRGRIVVVKLGLLFLRRLFQTDNFRQI